MSQNDLHIEILKYGKDNIEKGVTFSDLKKHLKGKGFSYDSKQEENYWRIIFQNSFQAFNGGGLSAAFLDSEKNPSRKEDLSSINVESYFRLMEHEELKQARKSSFWATVFAIIAIVISIIGTGFSIYFSMQPITLNSEQMKEIKNLKFNQSSVEKKLDLQIDNQLKLIESIDQLKKDKKDI